MDPSVQALALTLGHARVIPTPRPHTYSVVSMPKKAYQLLGIRHEGRDVNRKCSQLPLLQLLQVWDHEREV